MQFGTTGTGYVNPIQPIGNEDAYAFLEATRWPAPMPLAKPGGWPAPTMRHALGERCCPTATPMMCAPKRPDFYQQWPGSYPSGPIDIYHEPWPAGAKPYPGSPIVSDGRGGYAAPQPQLPSTTRGVATTPSQTIAEAPFQAEGGAAGGSWWWLLVLGFGLGYAVTRGGRG